MAEGFRFMPLGLVRLRNFQLMGYLGATLTQVFTCADGADMSLGDVTITQMGNWATECEWHHAPEARVGFGDFEKIRAELSPASEEDGWLSLARGGFGQVLHEMGGGQMKKPE